MILPDDRRMAALWAEHGIPFDRSTVEAAGQILAKALAEADEWKRIATQLADQGGES